ncbi:MAG: hypothetical protein CME90_10965 [Hoeflea sp.]|nr:hypothetical protein [Hoeflea sp.]
MNAISSKNAATASYSTLAELTRSDQLTAEQVEHLFEDNPEFARWYRKHAADRRNNRNDNGHFGAPKQLAAGK